MDWLSEIRDRHRGRYQPYGKCLSCRRGKAGCIGGRYKNDCQNYIDNTPIPREHLEEYGRLVMDLLSAEREPLRGDLLGAALSRRKFLRFYLKIEEKTLRAVEDLRYSSFPETDERRRIIRRLRWEL
jgi:hypothetical protein